MFKFFKLMRHKHFWRETYWGIRDFLAPKQKWLTREIPKSWVDKDFLIQKTLFACLIHFVEQEKGMDQIWSEELYGPRPIDDNNPIVTVESWDERKRIRKELDEVYRFIKEELPELEKRLYESYPKPLIESDNFFEDRFVKMENGNYQMKSSEEIYGKSYEEAYSEHNRIEKLIETGTSWALQKIVEYRVHLWT